MRVIIAFTILIAGISASILPQNNKYNTDFSDERLVSGPIINAIEGVSQAIQDAGLDPLHIKREGSSFELPVPVIFNYAAFVEDVISNGLSNIVVHRVNYNVITSRMNFDIELPLIHFSVGAAFAKAEVFGNHLTFSASGKVEIDRIRVTGQVRVNVGIISGISIRSIEVDLTLGDIHSDVNLEIMGKDFSNEFNGFVGGTVPETIKAFNSEINELLEIVLLEVINANL